MLLRFVSFLAALLVSMSVFTQPVQSMEKPVKAAFVCQFPSFLQWERHAPPTEGDTVRLGILGDDPFGGALEEAVKAQRAKGRRFEVIRSKDAGALLNCHVVCIGMEPGEAFDAALAKLHDAGVATICDRTGAGERGVLINFVLVESRVCFEINLDTSREVGIKISSQLLKLAIIIQTADNSPESPEQTELAEEAPP